MSLKDADLVACTPSAFTGNRRQCRWCDGPLTGRQQRWCGQGCVDAYLTNHAWPQASKAALERDGWTCLRCGRVGWRDVPTNVLAMSHRPGDPEGYRSTTTTAGGWARAVGLIDAEDWAALRDIESPVGLRNGAQRRVRIAEMSLPKSILTLIGAEQTAYAEMVRRELDRIPQQGSHDLEVNHVDPRLGRGYGVGCWHHLDGLETLCRACHVAETNRQRAERRPAAVSVGTETLF